MNNIRKLFRRLYLVTPLLMILTASATLVGFLHLSNRWCKQEIRLETLESNLIYEIQKVGDKVEPTTEESLEEQSCTAAIPEPDATLHILQIDDKLWQYEGELTDNYVIIHMNGQKYAMFMPADSEEGGDNEQ